MSGESINKEKDVIIDEKLKDSFADIYHKTLKTISDMLGGQFTLPNFLPLDKLSDALKKFRIEYEKGNIRILMAKDNVSVVKFITLDPNEEQVLRDVISELNLLLQIYLNLPSKLEPVTLSQNLQHLYKIIFGVDLQIEEISSRISQFDNVINFKELYDKKRLLESMNLDLLLDFDIKLLQVNKGDHNDALYLVTVSRYDPNTIENTKKPEKISIICTKDDLQYIKNKIKEML
ncbi:MAG: hypothetical protein ACP6IP_09575 [Candidatus Njordarchaeia archaeon]